MTTAIQSDARSKSAEIRCRCADGAEGSCRIWWGGGWRAPEAEPGLIGALVSSSRSLLQAVLERACMRLTEMGAEVAYGPVDGSIWRRYRLPIENGALPVLDFEPRAPASWSRWFKEEGFHPVATYRTALVKVPVAPTLASDRRLPWRRAVQVRNLDASRLLEELRRLHALAEEAFEQSLLFAPLSSEEFLSLYAERATRDEPMVCLMAEDEGRLVGFLYAFSVRNWPRPEDSGALVVKTLAVRPGRRYAGLGRHLVDIAHERSVSAGLTAVIHAVMREGGASDAFSRRTAQTIRRYALFRRSLR